MVADAVEEELYNQNAVFRLSRLLSKDVVESPVASPASPARQPRRRLPGRRGADAFGDGARYIGFELGYRVPRNGTPISASEEDQRSPVFEQGSEASDEQDGLFSTARSGRTFRQQRESHDSNLVDPMLMRSLTSLQAPKLPPDASAGLIPQEQDEK